MIERHELRLKWTQKSGLFALPHDDLIDAGFRPIPFHIAGRNLCDVDRWNFTAEPYSWPNMAASGWRDEVKRALIALDVESEFESCTMYTKSDVALIAMDLVENRIEIEEACLRLHRARALI